MHEYSKFKYGGQFPCVQSLRYHWEERRTNMVAFANITHRDPDILSGSLVFVGTRVPVRSLFDYLEGGESIDEFLHQFPSVKREFAIAVLDAAYETVAANLNIA